MRFQDPKVSLASGTSTITLKSPVSLILVEVMILFNSEVREQVNTASTSFTEAE